MKSYKLTYSAKFEGVHEIPIIDRPSRIIIPASVVPFSNRKRVKSSDNAICFYEKDNLFSEIFSAPAKYLQEFKNFQAVISPDFSMYRDYPLWKQIDALGRNREIGSFWQRRGVNVIPNIRWGSEDTYTTSVLPEKVAFIGVPKHSIVALGSYGCFKHMEDRYHFQAGLAAMMETLEPEIVLVYGAMPDSIFVAYQMYAKFIQYDNWTKRIHKGGI